MKLFALIAFAGIAAAQPAFDVAVIKVTSHGAEETVTSRTSGTSIGYGRGRFQAENASLATLIQYAYGIYEYQLICPEWMKSDKASFDIQAKTGMAITEKQALPMLQTLLAQRFGLTLHREKRTLPVYNLVVGAKGASNLKKVAEAEQSGMTTRNGHLTATSSSMADLAEFLSHEAGRPVLDKTGMAGSFDFKLSYTPGHDDSPELPSVFTAVREQLGLKLEPTKGPAEVLVIDHAERMPSEN